MKNRWFFSFLLETDGTNSVGDGWDEKQKIELALPITDKTDKKGAKMFATLLLETLSLNLEKFFPNTKDAENIHFKKGKIIFEEEKIEIKIS